MKTVIFNILILHVGLLYSQSIINDYNHFTPERRQVLSEMGAFFDETIRKNFPAETDSLSYLNFAMCTAHTGFDMFILDIDRSKLKEINQMLFRDHNYYFFYARYIYMGKVPPPGYKDPIDVDSVPTVRSFGSINWGARGIRPILNKDGYINVIPDDNPVIIVMKDDMERAGDFGISIFMGNVLLNLREVSQPIVKELCAVAFWRYLCVCGGVDLVGRKSFCEPCGL